MEKRLDEIEDGEENWVEVVDSFFKPLSEKISIAEQNISKVTLEEKVEVTDVICEKCGRNMVIKKANMVNF